MFVLDDRLKADSHFIVDLPLCSTLLMDDAHYPWCILVPRRESLKEAFELTEADQHQLQRESLALAQCMSHLFHADKMNIAAIGNIVSQLHIHHVARYKDDVAWPKPVWGHVCRQAYSEKKLSCRLALLKTALQQTPLL